MSDKKRNYQKKRRADAEAHTRLRITEATVELHGTLGPARTSISAIAKRASVRRSTVYRHFPNELTLFTACSAHWLAANPLPDMRRWAAIAEPHERLTVALREIYAYYRQGEQMLQNILRDEANVPVITGMLEGFRAYLDAARDVLMDGRIVASSATEKQVRSAIGHALAFSTWRSLVRGEKLSRSEAAALMGRLVAAAAYGQIKLASGGSKTAASA